MNYLPRLAVQLFCPMRLYSLWFVMNNAYDCLARRLRYIDNKCHFAISRVGFEYFGHSFMHRKFFLRRTCFKKLSSFVNHAFFCVRNF